MIVENALKSVYQHFPTSSKILKCTLTMATAAIALEALSAMPSAAAGPLTYAACVAACAFSAPPVLPICLAACAPSLGPWCP